MFTCTLFIFYILNNSKPLFGTHSLARVGLGGSWLGSENLEHFLLGGLLINMEVSSYNLSTVISDCLLMRKEGKLVPLSQARQARVAYVRFTTLTQEEVEKMSIMEVTEKVVHRGG